MNKIILTLVASIAFTGFLGAQPPCPGNQIKHTLPAGFENVDGNYTNTFGGWTFNVANGTRWQYAYPWTEFVHQAPVTICEIAFRNVSDASFTGGTYAGVDVILSSAANPHNMMSTTFANNLDVDQTQVVLGGTVTIPTYTAPAMPAATAPFNVTIPFNFDQFRFDPSQQKDLVIDITVNGPITGLPTFAADGRFPTQVGSQTGHNANPASGSSNWQNLDACPIIEITYSLGSDQHFNLIAQTGGGGTGDLALGYLNVPAGTVEGYTFVSTIPYNIIVPGAEFGTGPMFGIFPDSTTFAILFTVPSLGNPIHWTYPAGGAVFPDVAINLPPGTLSSLSGQIWEVVGVAIGPGLNFLGATQPVQVNW